MVKGGPPSEHELDAIFTALADSSRRTIVRRVAARVRSALARQALVWSCRPPRSASTSRSSKNAGLIVRRLDGRRHILSLESERLLLAEDWIARYRTLWTTSAGRLADSLPHSSSTPNKETRHDQPD